MLEYYIITEPSEANYKPIGSGLEKCMFVLVKNDYQGRDSKLSEIIKAVGLDPKKDVVICLIEDRSQHSILNAIEDFGINRVVSFGIDIDTLFPNMMIGHYTEIKTEDYHWLTAPSISLIMTDPAEKRRLWKGLKIFFGLSSK